MVWGRFACLLADAVKAATSVAARRVGLKVLPPLRLALAAMTSDGRTARCATRNEVLAASATVRGDLSFPPMRTFRRPASANAPMAGVLAGTNASSADAAA